MHELKLLRACPKLLSRVQSKKRDRVRGTSYVLALSKARRKLAHIIGQAKIHRSARLARLANSDLVIPARVLRRTSAVGREATFCLKSPVKNKKVMMGEGDDDGRTMATVMSVDQTTLRAGAPMDSINELCGPSSGVALVGRLEGSRDVDMQVRSFVPALGCAYTQTDRQGDAYMRKETLSVFSRGGCAWSSSMDVDGE